MMDSNASRQRVRRGVVRRWVVRVVVLLLLGAVVNVAVAWGCVLFVPDGGFDSARIADQHCADIVSDHFAQANLVSEPIFGTRFLRYGCTTVQLQMFEEEEEKVLSYGHRPVLFGIHSTRAGWPVRSLDGHWKWDGRHSQQAEAVRAWTLDVPEWLRVSYIERRLNAFLPLRPMWSGFVINTTFYGAVLWTLVVAPFALRRLRRVRKGLCAACAYPVGESVICTECGHAVRRAEHMSRRHPCRRWTVRVVVVLLLGAMVNVAVAWGCSWLVVPARGETAPTTLQEFWPTALIPDDAEGSLCQATRWHGFGVDEVDLLFIDYGPIPLQDLSRGTGIFADEPRSPASFARELAAQIEQIYWENSEADVPDTAVDLRQQLHELLNRKTLDLHCRAGWPMRCVHGWASSRLSDATSTSAFAIDAHPDGHSFSKIRKKDGKQLLRVLPYMPLWPGFAINTIFYAVMLCLVFTAPFALRRRRRVRKGLCATCAYPVGESDVCTECGHAARR